MFPYPSNSAANEGSKYLVLAVELITRFVEKRLKLALCLIMVYATNAS